MVGFLIAGHICLKIVGYFHQENIFDVTYKKIILKMILYFIDYQGHTHTTVAWYWSTLIFDDKLKCIGKPKVVGESGHSPPPSHSFIKPQRACREGYSSHFVCLSVCPFFILKKAPFSVLKLTSRFKSFKSSTFFLIKAILEKKRVELRQ